MACFSASFSKRCFFFCFVRNNVMKQNDGKIMKLEWNRCSKTESGSKLLVVNLVGTLQKNVVIHFSYGSAAACFIFEVTNLAFRRLGNRDADGCGPFPKDSHESQIWKSERQCFDWGCQNKKLLQFFAYMNFMIAVFWMMWLFGLNNFFLWLH